MLFTPPTQAVVRCRKRKKNDNSPTVAPFFRVEVTCTNSCNVRYALEDDERDYRDKQGTHVHTEFVYIPVTTRRLCKIQKVKLSFCVATEKLK